MAERSFHPLQGEINHVILWFPNWIGDVVLVLPTVESLRRKFPNVRITAVAGFPSDEILQAYPQIDTVLRLPGSRGSGGLEQIRFAYGLRKYQADLGAVFSNSLRSAFLLYLTGTRHRLGYSTDGRGAFLTHPLPATYRERHTQYRVDYYFNILSGLGLEPPEMKFSPLDTLEGDATPRDLRLQMGLGPNEFFITLHPGTSKPERSWHADRYGILCQKIVKEHKIKIALLGSDKEKDLLAQVRRFVPAEWVADVPEMNLRGVAALLRMSGLFIGNDSGMMHLAAMMGTSVVGVFGPGSPETTGPFIEKEKREMVTRHYPCSPCRQRFFKECKPSLHHKPFCLEDISVKEVSEAVGRLLRRLR